MSNIPENADVNCKSDNLVQPSQAQLCYTDLCLSGKIWNNPLISSLLDAKITCIPVVHAAAPVDTTPKKPPPMRYKDLPIAECNEFYEYKTYLEDQQKYPGSDVKILHKLLCPKVHKFRTSLADTIFGITGDLASMKNEAKEAADKHLRCFVRFMRHPDNLLIRRAVVVLGTLTGIYIGSGTRGISKKIFFGTLGALAAGALCFPKETDVIFRNTSYNLLKFTIVLYNCICGKQVALRERVPCPSDLPPPPPPRQPHEVNKKCDPKFKGQADAKGAAAAKAKPQP